MTYKKKLIEVALPLAAISDASAREKLVKRGKPSSIHLWWARRPFVSARAVLWASLVDDPSAHPERFPTEAEQQEERDRLFNILQRLVNWDLSNDPETLGQARKEIESSCGAVLPTVVDPFGGGATIPLEALRLGLSAVSGDLNPVATLIQRGMLDIPYRFDDGPSIHPGAPARLSNRSGRDRLAEDFKLYGEDLRVAALTKLAPFYPNVISSGGDSLVPVAWIWARTVESPDPSWRGHVPLVGSWLLRNAAPRVWVSPRIDDESQVITYEISGGGSPPEGTVGRAGARCIATGSPIPFAYIREQASAGKLGTTLLAIVAEGNRTRVYVPPSQGHVDAASGLKSSWSPDERLQGKARQNVSLYGLDRFSQLFTARQLGCLTHLVDLLPALHEQVVSDAVSAGLHDDGVRLRDGGTGAQAYGDAITTFLAFAIDRLADWNNSLCRWENKAQVPQQLFGRHSMPMVWDFAEANVFSASTGSLSATLNTLSTAIMALPNARPARVEQLDAEALVDSVGACVVSTDPPYYANINYADLADFFYVWMRRSLAEIWPDECATLLTPKDDEIIANYFSMSKQKAHGHFEAGVRRVFEAVARNQIHDYPSTIFYAYKQAEDGVDGRISTGWETFIQGLLDAGLAVTATWPIRTENHSRLMAAGTNALASSIVLACRPRRSDAVVESRGRFVAELRSRMPEAVKLLQRENIAPVDLAQSAIGPGIAIFSSYLRVVEANGDAMSVRTALSLINEVLSEVLSGEESEFDADTRFALTWFEQYGHSPGPYGDADLLARAKDTTVAGVGQSGVVVSRDGKVRLVERTELPPDWDPATDSRLTVWEATQHMISALDSSEIEAALLLSRLGPGLGDRSRQLAYLLYGLCDRKKWAEEAAAYNMLVTAWPEISRLAAAGPAPETTGSLF